MVRKNTTSKKTHKRKNGRKTMKGGGFFGKTKM
jgi:hypothetical protein